MVEITHPGIAHCRASWVAAGRPTPLEVSRSDYGDGVVSWEVLWYDTLWDGNWGSATPIAEFTTWWEANDWAQREAAKSTLYRIGVCDWDGNTTLTEDAEDLVGWWTCPGCAHDHQITLTDERDGS